MGRIKQGLDYFPMSTSFMHDRIVRRVMKREGDAAFATLVETLSYIYAGKGYYISVGDEFYEELVDSLKNDITILIVTHNMQQAARISDKCAFFLVGDLIEFGETEQVFSMPKDKRTEDYITGRFG